MVTAHLCAPRLGSLGAVGKEEQEQTARGLWDQRVGEMPFLHQDPDTPHPPQEHPVQMHLDMTFLTRLVPRSCQLASA